MILLAVEAARARAETIFWSYGQFLENVGSFKYLNDIILSNYDGYPAVISNLRKARKKWAYMSMVMYQEG